MEASDWCISEGSSKTSSWRGLSQFGERIYTMKVQEGEDILVLKEDNKGNVKSATVVVY